MERRVALSAVLLGACGQLALGCRARRRRYDDAPDRGLLEDRWPGHVFDTLEAEYTLPLTNPSTSLSRAEGNNIPVVSSDGIEVATLAPPLTIRPELAIVKLSYTASRNEDSLIFVTVRWPSSGTAFNTRQRYVDETTTTEFSFQDARKFIDGTGRFRCDRDECFYGAADREMNVQHRDGLIEVQFAIAGPNADSRFEGDFQYKDQRLLWDLAEKSIPGLG